MKRLLICLLLTVGLLLSLYPVYAVAFDDLSLESAEEMTVDDCVYFIS